MADLKHVDILRQGEVAWNTWRDENRDIVPDLHKAELQGLHLENFDLGGADLREARFAWADLRAANLVSADLSGAKINDARAPYANFSNSLLLGAYLWGSDFREAVFRGADLSGSNLMCTQLVGADFSGADLTGCSVYGTAAWEVKLEGAVQDGLIITPPNLPAAAVITLDDLQVAQFVYMLLDNKAVRHVIDTVTSKLVLILGRFEPEQKAVLDALRSELRQRDYLPVVFDFDVPKNRDLTETVSLLARMARFVVADITNAASIPQELMVIVPDLPSVPVQPLLLEGAGPYAMFEHLQRFPWMLPVYSYTSGEQLIADLGERVIGPAEDMVRTLRAGSPR